MIEDKNLLNGAPLMIEDLDVTMNVKTYTDPTYVKYWRFKSFLSWFKFCEHPSITQAKLYEKYWSKFGTKR